MAAVRRCDWCGEIKDCQFLRLQLRIAARNGNVVHKDFCSDECLRDSTIAAITDRDETRRLRAEGLIVGDQRPPSPADLAPLVVS